MSLRLRQGGSHCDQAAFAAAARSQVDWRGVAPISWSNLLDGWTVALPSDESELWSFPELDWTSY